MPLTGLKGAAWQFYFQRHQESETSPALAFLGAKRSCKAEGDKSCILKKENQE